VKKATKSETVGIVLAFICLFVVMIAGSIAVWLTSEVRVFGLVLLPTAIVAGLLVLYFDWRVKLRNRILADRDDHEKAA
jgi:Na+/glutamate symporter